MISTDNMKMVVIINGRGGVGKDTLCNIISKHYDIMNVSSIDPIKQIAFANGWNGEKNEKTRKFLADLKRLFIDFNDLPTIYLMIKYSEFVHSKKQILFMQIREPEEIEKIKKILGNDCVTLLICGRTALRKTWGNAPDDEVDNYTYDFYYKNSKPLDILEQDFLNFFKEMIYISRKENN